MHQRDGLAVRPLPSQMQEWIRGVAENLMTCGMHPCIIVRFLASQMQAWHRGVAENLLDNAACIQAST